jgi:UDP:flavonoid glycosyltransferase YjiC (YdhE family)
MKVVCYTSPARGHLFPTVPILLELQRRGHEVVVRTLGAEAPGLRELGLKADAVDPRILTIELTDYRPRTPQAKLRSAVRTIAERAEIEVPDVQDLIAAERPDVLLIDGNAWGATAAAEASGLPWAMLQHFPTPLPSPEVPPFGPGLRHRDGRLWRLRNRLLQPIILGTLERTIIPPLNQRVRPLAGAAPARNATDLYASAPLTLYLTSRAFEYPRSNWPDSYCFIGPLTWEPPQDPPAWLPRRRNPVALVTTSSEFQDDGDLVRTSLSGLAMEELEVVATMPAGLAAGLDVPSNARVEEFLPHSLVLPHAAVAITHGGMGATQKALAAGVPVVVVPWGRDQAEVGRRAERAGAGVLLPKRKFTADTLRDAVRRARTLKPEAENLAARYAEEGGATLAADRLEALVHQFPG